MSLNKNSADIASMFDKIALNYDKNNDILSLAQTKRWRRVLAEAVLGVKPVTVLDVAAGTGTSSAAFVAEGVSVVACDFSEGMLEVGRKRFSDIDFVFADATALPFADDSFDVVTISYGLRNVDDVQKALGEMLRVVKPGGKLFVAEFSHPTLKVFRMFYMNFFMRLLPLVAKCVGSDSQSYQYLVDSIRQWPDQRGLAKVLCEVGWVEVKYRNLSGGIVALHCGSKLGK